MEVTISIKDGKLDSISATPTAQHTVEKKWGQQLVAEISQSLLEKIIGFAVDKDPLIKERLSKQLYAAGEFYANKDLIQGCQLPPMEDGNRQEHGGRLLH